MINWMIVAVALVGVVLNARGKWHGFLFWLISNAWWCCYNFKAGEIAQSALFGVFWWASLFGIFFWRKNQKYTAKKLEQAVAKAKQFETSKQNSLLYDNAVMAKYINDNKHLLKKARRLNNGGKKIKIYRRNKKSKRQAGRR